MNPEKDIKDKAEQKTKWLLNYNSLIKRVHLLDKDGEKNKDYNPSDKDFFKKYWLDLIKLSYEFVEGLDGEKLVDSNNNFEESHSSLRWQFDGFFKNFIEMPEILGIEIDISDVLKIRPEGVEISRATSAALAVEVVMQDKKRNGVWF